MGPADPTVIFETVHGSRAYGLATKSSDTDLRGVFVPPPLAFVGYVEGPEQIEPSAERVLFEIRKFFRLAAACNPSVIEVMFTDPEDHVTVSPEGARLLDRRGEFLSRLRATASASTTGSDQDGSGSPALASAASSFAAASIRSPTRRSSTSIDPSYSARFRFSWHAASTRQTEAGSPSVWGKTWNDR
jgi:hypothetical protein